MSRKGYLTVKRNEDQAVSTISAGTDFLNFSWGCLRQ